MDYINRIIKKWLAQLREAEHTFIVIVAVIIGILSGFGAVGFRFLIRLFQSAAFQDWHYSLSTAEHFPVHMKIIVPAVGGLIVGIIIYFFAREAKGHGVPEVMEAVALRGGFIRFRVVIAKAFASAICIGSGGSVGREGPIVQIGSALGSTVSQFLKLPSNMMRTFVGCGAAAGIAATFNAPIAGALFAVEIILSEFGILQFSPIVISSVIATVISRHFLGDFPAFVVPEYQLVSPLELGFYIILGVAAGGVAFLFVKVLYGCEDIFDSIPIPEYTKPLFGGIIIGCIAIIFPQIYGVGYETINAALTGELLGWGIFLLIFIKIMATSVTIGSGGSGGIFAPSLFIGAMTGGAIGQVVHQLFPEISAASGAYALVGMGGVVAAATHAPITAIIIIFELTGEYKIIIPLMMTCIISTLLTTGLSKDSIYTLKLLRRNVNIFRGREINVLKSLYVKNVMEPIDESIPESTPLNQLLQRAVVSKQGIYFTVNNDNELSGIINPEEMKFAFFEKDSLAPVLIAKDLASSNLVMVTPEENLDSVLQLFTRWNMEALPVVESKNSKKLIGIITHHKVSEAYNREVFKRDIVEGVSGRISDMDKNEQRELIEGYVMTLVNAPFPFYWKSIRELDVRARYNVEIVLIQRSSEMEKGSAPGGESLKIVPNPDIQIKPGDSILVMGPRDKVEALKKI